MIRILIAKLLKTLAKIGGLKAIKALFFNLFYDILVNELVPPTMLAAEMHDFIEAKTRKAMGKKEAERLEKEVLEPTILALYEMWQLDAR